MTLLLNGSQKLNPSNSLLFLKYISKYLNDYKILSLMKNNYESILDALNNNDSIIIAFPLYVDSPNTITLSFLDYIYDNKISLNKKRVYFVINCGFREGEQNITALNIAKNWCLKVNAIYSGAILIGAGEVIGNRKLKFLSNKAFRKLKKFSLFVNNNTSCPEIITTVSFLGNKFYCKVANDSWNNKGKKNGLSKDDLRME